jgi:predicted Zn-dependent peptidase
MKRAGRVARVLLVVAPILAGCGGASVATTGPTRVDLPVSDGLAHTRRMRVEASALPPPPPAASSSEPAPSAGAAPYRLANGLELRLSDPTVVAAIELRLGIAAGAGYADAGVAELTARVVAAAMRRRLDPLGVEIAVRVEADATTFSATIPASSFEAALAAVVDAVRAPRLEGDELRKLRARAVDEAARAVRDGKDARRVAAAVLDRELFPAPNPRGVGCAFPAELARVELAAVRDFHRRFYVPKGARVALTGPADRARAIAERSFGAWSGAEPPKISASPPRALGQPRVVVAHRPRSAEAYVLAAFVPPGGDALRLETRSDVAATSAATAALLARAPTDAGKPLVVVSADADIVAADLARFGEVVVVDPEHDLKVVRTFPAKP